MSHFTVLVIGDDPEGQLAPFNEQDDEYCVREDITARTRADYQRATTRPEGTNVDVPCKDIMTFDQFAPYWLGSEDVEIIDGETHAFETYNPNAKWDWYRLGGRWRGFFKLKSCDNGEDVAELGESGVGGNEPTYDADQARKRDIDFEFMRNAAAVRAGEEWGKAHTIIAGRPAPKSWDTLLRDYKDGGQTAEQARSAYWAQPVVVDLDAAKLLGWGDDPVQFYCTCEDYTARAACLAISTFAVLMNGQWYEKGSMGWWGMVADEKDGDEWAKEFSKLLDSVPDDTMLSVYDCHI